MIIPSGYTLQDLKPYEINKEFNGIKTAFNGKIQFGQLNGKDRNMDGIMILHTFVAANVEEQITHNLGSIPIGYLTITNSNGGVIYDGVTRSTTSVIFLQSTTANNTVTLFILR